MRPRLALLVGAVLAPVLPLLSAAPAQAALGTICVGPVPAGTVCDTSRLTIQAAITDATSGDVIRVGTGPYTDGPYVLPAGVSLRGSGVGTGSSATKLSLLTPGAQTYVTVSGGGTVADLRVDMANGNGATGIAASGVVVDNVLVFGAGATNVTGLQAQGSQVHDATVNVTGGTGNTAVRSLGGNLLLSDSTWRGGAVGYLLVSGTDTVSRATVELADTAVLVQGGILNIDDSVLDLGTSGTRGLLGHPTGPATTVHADHLTVVGGAPAAAGVMADATDGLIDMTLTNSIVRGPTESLTSVAGGSLTVSRSDYETSSAGVTDTGDNLNVDPAFVDLAAGDYHLRATSPVADKGVLTPASLDRDGNQRFDADKDGTAQPDMGAYELVDVVAPKTVITGGPSRATNDNTPVFTFRSGPDATFECRLDASAYQPCTSPVTTTPLPDGAHTFTVRATDAVFNIEPSPPTRKFTVDTVQPTTKLTKKPRHRFFKPKVKFKFTSSEPGVHFQCQLDRKSWRGCRSPLRYWVKVGKHTLKVRAVDAAGNVDPTPAHYTFKRLKRHR